MATMKKLSSRQLAKTWPYPRHTHFRKIVEKAAVAWFAKKELLVQKKNRYVLTDRSQWPNNIIVPEVATYIQNIQAQRAEQGQNFALHNSVHNGLSSQAMLFNLLGPLVVTNTLSILKPLLPAEMPISAMFEYEDRTVFNEDSGQPTSVDMVLYDDQQQPRYFLEAKFVEQEFGGCSVFGSGDCNGRNPVHDFNQCYLHHIGRKYWERLQKTGCLEGALSQEKLCVLSQHYQFFRLLMFALAHDGHLVLLVDERSPAFLYNHDNGQRGLIPLLRDFVPDDIQSKITTITIQQVVNAIQASGQHDNWIAEFKLKYGLVKDD